jgi:GTP pyrophosphokinase
MDLRSIDGRTNGSMLVEVENLAHLEKIIRATRRIKGITEVSRRERLTTES